MRIEPMTEEHAAAVLAIYQAGIDEGNATFETRAPSWEQFSAARLAAHRFVAMNQEREADSHPAVLGWVAVSAVSARAAYAGVVEHSVYVHPGARGQGAGRAMLDALVSSTEAAGIWTIESGIFPENTASLALHRAAGFREVGIRERVARHDGRPGQSGGWWRDTVLIERRSQVAGAS
jgi:phosphinothricin acetyltransferase